MAGTSWRIGVLAALFGLVVLCGTRAADTTPTDEGKAADFKGKTYDLKEKGEVVITLTFASGKKAAITVKSEKKSDVNLFVYDADKKQVAKDDSPGPDCALSFEPKVSGKYTLIIRNLGPGDNKSALKVSVAK